MRHNPLISMKNLCKRGFFPLLMVGVLALSAGCSSAPTEPPTPEIADFSASVSNSGGTWTVTVDLTATEEATAEVNLQCLLDTAPGFWSADFSFPAPARTPVQWQHELPAGAMDNCWVTVVLQPGGDPASVELPLQ